ncbi:hypothetical protein BTS2_2412 [Bacillus sp. TS-2]|nr:hypothetical protein BTS2_2412 [Bacillus sp. TS-2]
MEAEEKSFYFQVPSDLKNDVDIMDDQNQHFATLSFHGSSLQKAAVIDKQEKTELKGYVRGSTSNWNIADSEDKEIGFLQRKGVIVSKFLSETYQYSKPHKRIYKIEANVRAKSYEMITPDGSVFAFFNRVKNGGEGATFQLRVKEFRLPLSELILIVVGVHSNRLRSQKFE